MKHFFGIEITKAPAYIMGKGSNKRRCVDGQ